MAVAAHYPLNASGVIAPIGCFDCFGQFVGGDLLAVPYGRGFFVFSHLRLLENLKNSHAASILIQRIVGFSLGLARPMIQDDVGFRAPSEEESNRVSLAMDNVRRIFSFIERLSLNMPGGKRKKRNFSEECLFYDGLRLKAIRHLYTCRFDKAAESLEELWESLPVEWKQFVSMEERFIERYNACTRKGKPGQALKPAMDKHKDALTFYAREEVDEAFRLLEEANDLLP
jgi:hypothetical protein